MSGGLKNLFKNPIGFCDVRDVARAHVNCLKFKYQVTMNERYIICKSSEHFSDIIKTLSKKYEHYDYPKKFIGGLALKIAALFDRTLKPLTNLFGKKPTYIREKANRDKIMGIFEYREVEDTLDDMVECFISKGFIEDKI
jgi:nucleoside-diphosphate-sugar epimerase